MRRPIVLRGQAGFLMVALMLALVWAAPLRGAATAAPQRTPGAAEIVSRWRDAVHARAQSAHRFAVTSGTSDQDGIPGTVAMRLSAAADGGCRIAVKRSFDDNETVVTGPSGLRRDWNGWLREIKGQEMQRLRGAILESRTIVFGPADEWTRAEPTRSDDGREYGLRLAPEASVPVTFWLDATTFLPVKSVRPGDDSTITTTYSRWGEMGGVRTPLEGTVSETDKPDYTWTRTSVRYEARAPEGAFAPPRPGPTDVHLDPKAPPIPFDFASSHIIINASVNGRPPIGFILDTGADENVIHSARLAGFGLKTYAKTVTTGGGGSAEYAYARGATITLPGVTLRDQHVAVIDQSGLERALGMPLGGLLGYDFISRFVIEIDYEKKVLTLHDAAAWTYSGNGAIVPVVFDRGIPFAGGTISVGPKRDIPAQFVVDFGAAETATLTSPFVKTNDLLTLARTNSSVNNPALPNQFFSQTNVRGRIDRLTLGPLVAESIPVNLSMNTTGAYASPSFSGTVGQGIDRRYHVFLDYARSRVIYEPTAEAAKPFPERQTYGLTLLASGGDLRTYSVSAVRPGSPAEADGFRKDDVVATFDDKPAADFTLADLRDWLGRAGERHTLTIARAGATVTLPVEVRLVSLDAK